MKTMKNLRWSVLLAFVFLSGCAGVPGGGGLTEIPLPLHPHESHRDDLLPFHEQAAALVQPAAAC